MELQNNATIMGEKDQLLQIILKKNDSIVIKKQNLYYFSSPDLEETLFIKKTSSNDESIIKIGKRVRNDNLVKLRNLNNNFEYVGVYNGGKSKLFLYILNNFL
jgi:hypothetical protein